VTSQLVAISVWAINASTQLAKMFICFPMFLETQIFGNNLMYMRINFEDHALIKIWQACSKLNVMGELFKDKRKHGNHRKEVVFIIGSCAHF